MSLNGLEATVVTETYQSAYAQGGGWLHRLIYRYRRASESIISGRFLLDYTALDGGFPFSDEENRGLVEVKEGPENCWREAPNEGTNSEQHP